MGLACGGPEAGTDKACAAAPWGARQQPRGRGEHSCLQTREPRGAGPARTKATGSCVTALRLGAPPRPPLGWGPGSAAASFPELPGGPGLRLEKGSSLLGLLEGAAQSSGSRRRTGGHVSQHVGGAGRRPCSAHLQERARATPWPGVGTAACVTWDKPLFLSEPQCPHPETGWRHLLRHLLGPRPSGGGMLPRGQPLQ